DLEADGELHREGGSLPLDRFNVKRTSQPCHRVAHHIEADAAPTLFGERFCSSEALAEDKVNRLFLCQMGIGIDPAKGDGPGPYPLGIDAGAIVTHRDDNLIALIGRRDDDGPGARFAVPLAGDRRLDAMIDRVAHQMQQGTCDLFEDLAVHLSLGALSEELDLLPLAGRGGACRAKEARHKRLQRHKTRLEQTILEVRAEAALAGEGGLTLADERFHFMGERRHVAYTLAQPA